MKHLSDNALCRAVCEKCRALFGYQLRHKYDMSLWLYSDEQTDSPECTHRWTGDSRHSIWKIVAILGGTVLFFGLIRALCRLMKRV